MAEAWLWCGTLHADTTRQVRFGRICLPFVYRDIGILTCASCLSQGVVSPAIRFSCQLAITSVIVYPRGVQPNPSVPEFVSQTSGIDSPLSIFVCASTPASVLDFRAVDQPLELDVSHGPVRILPTAPLMTDAIGFSGAYQNISFSLHGFWIDSVVPGWASAFFLPLRLLPSEAIPTALVVLPDRGRQIPAAAQNGRAENSSSPSLTALPAATAQADTPAAAAIKGESASSSTSKPAEDRKDVKNVAASPSHKDDKSKVNKSNADKSTAKSAADKSTGKSNGDKSNSDNSNGGRSTDKSPDKSSAKSTGKSPDKSTTKSPDKPTSATPQDQSLATPKAKQAPVVMVNVIEAVPRTRRRMIPRRRPRPKPPRRRRRRRRARPGRSRLPSSQRPSRLASKRRRAHVQMSRRRARTGSTPLLYPF